MIESTGLHLDTDPGDREKAKATARMIYYAACDAEELGLGECRQLLMFCGTLMRIKFGLKDHEVLLDPQPESCSS